MKMIVCLTPVVIVVVVLVVVAQSILAPTKSDNRITYIKPKDSSQLFADMHGYKR